MTMHLSSQEFVSALGGKDGELSAARQSHLDQCEACQAQVVELRALLEEVSEESDVPEPSPLFWDHFQTRVLTAAKSEDQVAAHTWWKRLGMALNVRAFVAVSAVVMAVAASAAVYFSRPATQSDSGAAVESGVVADASAATVETSLENDEWAFVSSVMDTLEGDDIHEVLAPSHDAVDTAIEALTSEQRDRFMKLLKAQMSEGLE